MSVLYLLAELYNSPRGRYYFYLTKGNQIRSNLPNVTELVGSNLVPQFLLNHYAKGIVELYFNLSRSVSLLVVQ